MEDSEITAEDVKDVERRQHGHPMAVSDIPGGGANEREGGVSEEKEDQVKSSSSGEQEVGEGPEARPSEEEEHRGEEEEPAPARPSAGPRAPRTSTRRDAMAKFQKDPTPGVRNFKVQRTTVGGASIKQKILQWCRNRTQNYEGVTIENFSSSWSDGLAFCALVHHFFPTAFDFSSLSAGEPEQNFSVAFSTAQYVWTVDRAGLVPEPETHD